MKKSDQLAINAHVTAFLHANPELTSRYVTPDTPWKQLRACSADVARIGSLIVLRSYSTIIACIDTRTDTLYDFLRYVYGYTATSAQHITKFAAEYYNCEANRMTYKEV